MIYEEGFALIDPQNPREHVLVFICESENEAVEKAYMLLDLTEEELLECDVYFESATVYKINKSSINIPKFIK